MFEKIKKAAFEERLFAKVIQYIRKVISSTLRAVFIAICSIPKLPGSFVNGVDKIISRSVRRLYCRFTKVDPNKIVFMTYRNDFDCNPKYIAEEILRQGLPWDLVWVVPKRGSMYASHFPQQIRRVRRDKFPAFHEIATARVWIDNSINFLWTRGIRKKKNQVYFETWHGSMGIKRAVSQDPYWRKRAKLCRKEMDFCISNSDFENTVYRTTHWPRTPILLYGHPRNDCLFDKEKMAAVKKRLWHKYHLKANERVLLYAPTFRNDGRLDCYDVDYEGLRKALVSRFGGTWKIFLRLHFHDRKTQVDRSALPKFVIDVTDYLDMQELLMAVDAGMTDYSSWAYDYVLTRRPLFIFATDVKKYGEERGLYYPLHTTPFPIASGNKQLIQNVRSFDDVSYQQKIDDFLLRLGCAEDGHAAERVVEKLKEIMGDTRPIKRDRTSLAVEIPDRSSTAGPENAGTRPEVSTVLDFEPERREGGLAPEQGSSKTLEPKTASATAKTTQQRRTRAAGAVTQMPSKSKRRKRRK